MVKLINILNNKLKLKFVAAVLAFGAILLLTGCSSKLVVLNPKGMIASDERDLIIISALLILIVVIPVYILTFIIARKYRASNTKAKYTPNWAHNNLLEIFWWTIPGIIITVLAIITWVTTHRLDPYKPLNSTVKPVTIQVVALRWKWLFIYPKRHIATVNYIEFPVNTPVNFLITSDAPMNAFQIPALGGQIYAMNGMQTKLHLIASHIGDYNGRSVSFSGAGFNDMKFIARATTKQDFQRWVQTVQQSSQALTMSAYKRLAEPSENNKVQYFYPVANNLFRRIILKFLDPSKRRKIEQQLLASSQNQLTGNKHA